MQAREIARLIMVAMNHDCCRYLPARTTPWKILKT